MKLIHFEKKLGIPGGVAVTVGAVIGVGVFIIVGPIGANTGAWMPLAFAVAAIPAFFGTMVAVALGSTIPADGGGFFYSRSLLGRYLGVTTSALIVVGALGSIAAVSIGIADYLNQSYLPGVPRMLLAIVVILVTWGINLLGLMTSEKWQIGMVVQLLSALLLIIVLAFIKGGSPDFHEPLPKGLFPGFFEGAVVAMMAFTGFNILGELGDEVENPRRNLPVTIALGLGIITLIYVGVGWVVAGNLSVAEMKTSKVALLDATLRYLPYAGVKHYLNLAALFAGLTSINAVFLAVPREFSAMAEDGILPPWIMKFDAKRQTFPVGMGLTAVVGAGLTLFNLNPDLYGLLCVSGLMLANFILSLGALRLFRIFPEKVASAPLSIKRWWVFPTAIISALLSLAFGVLAIVFFWQISIGMGLAVALGLFLCWKNPAPHNS